MNELSSEILEAFIDFVDTVELIYRVEDLDLKNLTNLMNHLNLVFGSYFYWHCALNPRLFYLFSILFNEWIFNMNVLELFGSLDGM